MPHSEKITEIKRLSEAALKERLNTSNSLEFLAGYFASTLEYCKEMGRRRLLKIKQQK